MIMKYSNDLTSEIQALKDLGTVKIDEPLKFYTTFNTGGLADILIYPERLDLVSDIVKIANLSKIPYTIIGGGSNLLIGDRGIRGLVIRLSEDNIMNTSMIVGEDLLVYSDAVITKERFIDFCIDAHYSGFEFLAGIPGTIGGGLKMNAGTYMGNFIDIISKVNIVTNEGEVETINITKDMCSYRNIDLPKGAIVLGGYFKLPQSLDPKKVRKEVETIKEDRGKKHPLEYPCAGSIFKNPEGYFSWKLVNDSGLKGKMIGGAQVSELHTNFIINKENATSTDIKQLIEHVQEVVFNQYQVTLEPEVKMLGEF